jgi:hypothetical protein
MQRALRTLTLAIPSVSDATSAITLFSFITVAILRGIGAIYGCQVHYSLPSRYRD